MINLNNDINIFISRHISFFYYFILPLFSRNCNAQTENSSHLVYNLNLSSRKIRCARENRTLPPSAHVILQIGQKEGKFRAA